MSKIEEILHLTKIFVRNASDVQSWLADKGHHEDIAITHFSCHHISNACLAIEDLVSQIQEVALDVDSGKEVRVERLMSILHGISSALQVLSDSMNRLAEKLNVISTKPVDSMKFRNGVITHPLKGITLRDNGDEYHLSEITRFIIGTDPVEITIQVGYVAMDGKCILKDWKLVELICNQLKHHYDNIDKSEP